MIKVLTTMWMLANLIAVVVGHSEAMYDMRPVRNELWYYVLPGYNLGVLAYDFYK